MKAFKGFGLVAAGFIALVSAGYGVSLASTDTLVCDDPVPVGAVPGAAMHFCRDGDGESRIFYCGPDGECSEMFQ